MARHAQRHRKPKAKLGGKNRRYVNQANLESFVKYSPEQSALRGLLRDARDEFRTGVKADKGAAGLVRRSAGQARKGVKKDYDTSIRSAKREDDAVASTLKNLGPAAHPFLAAIARESGGTRSRMKESRASTLSELESRRVDAAAGLTAAIRQRSGEFSRASRQVHERQLDIARERGAFTAATIGDLAEADRKLGVQIRGQNVSIANSKRTANTSRANSKRTARGQRGSLNEQRRHNRAMENAAKRKARAAARKANGKSRLTGDQRGQAQDGINSALRWIRRLSQSKMSPAAIKDLLITGGSIKVKRGGKTESISIPKIGHAGPIPGRVIVNAAFDIHRHGRITGKTRKRVRGAGLPRAWVPSKRRALARDAASHLRL